MTHPRDGYSYEGCTCDDCAAIRPMSTIERTETPIIDSNGKSYLTLVTIGPKGNDMRNIIDTMHTDQAIAVWRAAASFIEANDTTKEAKEAVTNAIGIGISYEQAELINHHIDALEAERLARCPHPGVFRGETCADCGKYVG